MQRILYGILMVALILIAAWMKHAAYTECRAHGFSVFYCSVGN